jgi:uncharacterized RDD family membrane protein YckC
MLYDSMLAVGVLALLFLAPTMIIAVYLQATLPGWAEWINVIAALGLYFVWLWHRNGQTLAMQTWRIRVVTVTDGQPPSIQRAIARYLLAWPSIVLMVGLIWALFDRDRQFLHDRLAGTRITFAPPTRS